MSTSIAQSRQQLSALIDLAQSEPQVIPRHNSPIGVLVSNEYYERTASIVLPTHSVYEYIMAVREMVGPLEDGDLETQSVLSQQSAPTKSWTRPNSFLDDD